MPNYFKYHVILVRYPFSDLSNAKVRPAVVVSAVHPSEDILITPLTSKTGSLLAGEFVLSPAPPKRKSSGLMGRRYALTSLTMESRFSHG